MTRQGIQPRWFFTFVAVYLFAVVILPVFVYPNLPLDTIEAIGWGNQWQWGYDKHPYLSAWLAAGAAWLSHPSPWALYALSAACVLLAFYFVYQAVLIKRDAVHAWMAVCLSASVYYFSTTTLEFNVNVLLLPLYAGMMYYALLALDHQKWRHWVGVGAAIALGMVTKYTMAIYALPVLVWVLFTPKGRRSFKHAGLYLGMVVAIAIILPHFIWLLDHHFETVTYALHRGDSVAKVMRGWPIWLRHVGMPIELLVMAVLPLLPALCLFRYGLGGRFKMLVVSSWWDRWDCYAWLMPFVVLMLMALLGIRVRTPYLLPLMVWIGPYLMLGFPCAMTHVRRVQVITMVLVVLYALVVAGAGLWKYHYKPGKYSRAFFRGNALAQTAENVWRQSEPKLPLRFVVGERWYSGNVSFYSPSYPVPFFTMASAWRERKAWLHQGVLLVIAPWESVKKTAQQWQQVLRPLKASAPQTTTMRQGLTSVKLTWVVFKP